VVRPLKERKNMEITKEQIEAAVKAGYPVTVIINGEYYTYKVHEDK
jgi:hypothetical protein